MNQYKQNAKIVTSIVSYLLENKADITSMTDDELYNNWSSQKGFKLDLKEQTDLAFTFLVTMRNANEGIMQEALRIDKNSIY